ncbi:MAG: HlyD family type I secretion periplasmic adaptor subunit [Methylococcaceae bacterium]|nr:HlyD family type I secretion periplasmic adaptor subunit [Methylococcaceae bacterium]
MILQLQAFVALLKHYSKVFNLSWQHRAEMESVDRFPYETQFLPAALSLQETPVSPIPRVTIGILIGFTTLVLLWSYFGQIDVVAIAQGKIVPNDRIKTIQAFETAKVTAIYVTDGQLVKTGDLLMKLDATSVLADKERIRGDLAVAHLLVARGEAMLTVLTSGKPPKLQTVAHIDSSMHQESARLVMAQYEEYIAKLSRFDAEVAKRNAELQSTQELVHKLEQTLPIAKKRAQDFKHLVTRHYVAEHDYLDREQTRIEQESDLANQRSRLKEIEAALLEASGQREEMLAESRRVSLDNITEGQQKAAALEQELVKVDSRSHLMQLTAPVDGIIQQLAVHTVGGVVTPAQPLMVIVPIDSTLEVEAFIENKDIGFVKANQDAEIKIETFQYTKYGTIHGKLISISHDAIQDEKRGLVYSGRFRLLKAKIDVEGAAVNLSSGMAVTAELKFGKRRVIEYFLNPLLQHGHESLRER